MFYAQSTITVISGRNKYQQVTLYNNKAQEEKKYYHLLVYYLSLYLEKRCLQLKCAHILHCSIKIAFFFNILCVSILFQNSGSHLCLIFPHHTEGLVLVLVHVSWSAIAANDKQWTTYPGLISGPCFMVNNSS